MSIEQKRVISSEINQNTINFITHHHHPIFTAFIYTIYSIGISTFSLSPAEYYFCALILAVPMSHRKLSNLRNIDLDPSKKISRIAHIRSLPSQQAFTQKINFLNFQTTPNKQQIALKRPRSHHILKPPSFGAVKLVRGRKADLQKKHEQITSSLSRSHTKINISGANRINTQIKQTDNLYSDLFSRIKNVVSDYQLRYVKCVQEKQKIVKENQKLKSKIKELKRSQNEYQTFSRVREEITSKRGDYTPKINNKN